MEFKVGFSKDIHRLIPSRKLVLGGVIIPFDKGEDAHSDGDVLYHALAESIFGALGKSDLGTYFPDNLNETKDMNSALIVEKAFLLMKEQGFEIGNIDLSICLEKPKLNQYILQMKKNISNILKCDVSQIAIKAMTNEHIGEIGEGKAVEAYSMVLLRR